MNKLKFEKISDDFFVADTKRVWNEKKDSYEIRLLEWKKVDGKEIKLPGFGDSTFFRHKEGRNWLIAEATTGMNINSFFEGFTLKQAKEDALRILNENKSDFDTTRESLIKEFGISPRYKLIKEVL
jgi:hypothetical protein